LTPTVPSSAPACPTDCPKELPENDANGNMLMGLALRIGFFGVFRTEK
jgi:hypothetical protein